MRNLIIILIGMMLMGCSRNAYRAKHPVTRYTKEGLEAERVRVNAWHMAIANFGFVIKLKATASKTW